MKKTFLAALAVLTLTLSAQAQQMAGQSTRPAKTEMHQQKGHDKKLDAQQLALRKAQQCRQELRLNDKQYDKVFKAYLAFFRQLDKQRPSEGQQHNPAQMKAEKDKLSKQMQKILSDVQFAEWQQLEQRQWHRGQKAQPGRDKEVRHPAGRPGQAVGNKQCGPDGCKASGTCPEAAPARPQHKVRPDSVDGFHGNSRR